MYYIQIPAYWFYFVLGIIVGIIGTICILFILANRIQKKNREQEKILWETLTKIKDENNDK